jgi:hypothetical protein
MAYCVSGKIGGTTFIARVSGKRPSPSPCQSCNRMHTKLCDKIVGTRTVIRRGMQEQVAVTCDAKMCDAHATAIDSKTDFCPKHSAEVANG